MVVEMIRMMNKIATNKMVRNQDAQFMLLGAFIIAIGLTVVTIMLSGIIFEGNKAIMAGSDESKTDMANVMQVTQDEIRNAYRNSTTLEEDDAINNFNIHMREFGNYLPLIYSVHGEGITIAWEDWNDKEYAYFTDNGVINGEFDWIVAENIQNSTIMVNITNISGSLNVNVVNATKTWQKNFSFSGMNIISDDDIKANINPPYSIKFINGSNANGKYSVIGNAVYGRNFIYARDYVLNTTITFSNSKVSTNVTVPISVPW